MGDAGAAFGSGMNFISDRMAEQNEAKQRDIDRMREDLYNQQQQRNWQTQFDYQKELNETQMIREDNAIQRSVTDHQAAGFNKLLAVGNQSASGGMTTFGGNAGGGVSSQIPQARSTDFLQMAQVMMDSRLKQSAISKSEAEADYTRQKTLTEIENTENLKIKNLSDEYKRTTDRYQRQLLKEQIREAESRIDTAYYNLGLSERRGIRTNDMLDSRALTVWALGNEFVSQFGDKALQEAKNWFGDGNNGFGNTPTPQKPGKDATELRKLQNQIWDFGDSQKSDDNLLDKIYNKFKGHELVKNMSEKQAKAYLMNLYVNKVK